MGYCLMGSHYRDNTLSEGPLSMETFAPFEMRKIVRVPKKKKQCLRPAYKPHFVRWRKVGLRSEEFLPDAPPGRSSLYAAYPELKRREQRLVPAWPCSRRGLPGRLHYCRRRWSLTPPFHHDRLAAAVCFCGPIRQVTSPRDFPGAVLCGVRTFLDSAPKRKTATVQPT